MSSLLAFLKNVFMAEILSDQIQALEEDVKSLEVAVAENFDIIRAEIHALADQIKDLRCITK